MSGQDTCSAIPLNEQTVNPIPQEKPHAQLRQNEDIDLDSSDTRDGPLANAAGSPLIRHPGAPYVHRV